jgi:hypothetical protein
MYAFLVSNSCYMSHPSHPPWFDHPNNIWWTVQIMKLLIMQSSPASCHLLPLRSKYSPQRLFSNTHNLFFHSVRDRVSHPYKTTGKIMVLYILILEFLERRWEEKSFWTEWQQAFPELNVLLMSLWIRLWCVAFVPKYLNIATFSKYLSN